MGVLKCDRNNCDAIMCDRVSMNHGYICEECFNELVNSGPETNITKFMETPKSLVNKQAALARFDVEFYKRRY